MEAKDVLTLPWERVKDWSLLSSSDMRHDGAQTFVSYADVDVFVENLYRDISRKLGVDYKELKKILEEQNTGFYLLKARLFDKGKLYSRDNRRLIELENTLRVPVVEEKDKLSECLKIFAELSDMEKVIFLQRIGKISVSIEEIEN